LVGVPGEGHIDDISIWEDIVDHFDLFDEEPLQKKASEIIDIAIKLLKASSDLRQVVDFDDMIYLPLFYRINFFQYDNVVMDEAHSRHGPRGRSKSPGLAQSRHGTNSVLRHRASALQKGTDRDDTDAWQCDLNRQSEV
jgi:hypothetical protein